jgi:2-dehydro-3-deoxy-L-rhamnonate dehydrogenase (NAD+)
MTMTASPPHSSVVFGAGSGIGAATAEALARRSDVVACLDVRADAAEATAARIRSAGGSASAWAVDIADDAQLVTVFDAVVAQFGQVHSVVNSVGIQGPLGVRSHEISLDAFDVVYRVNLRAALAISQVAVRHMLPFGYGRIAHVASIAGKEGNPGMISYSATKAGMIGMVKAQGKEYAKDGITINALAPAVIETDFLATQPDSVVAYMLEKIPVGRPGTVDEAAAILSWMTSRECSFTTGFTFDLSGGRATY